MRLAVYPAPLHAEGAAPGHAEKRRRGMAAVSESVLVRRRGGGGLKKVVVVAGKDVVDSMGDGGSEVRASTKERIRLSHWSTLFVCLSVCLSSTTHSPTH